MPKHWCWCARAPDRPAFQGHIHRRTEGIQIASCSTDNPSPLPPEPNELGVAMQQPVANRSVPGDDAFPSSSTPILIAGGKGPRPFPSPRQTPKQQHLHPKPFLTSCGTDLLPSSTPSLFRSSTLLLTISYIRSIAPVRSARELPRLADRRATLSGNSIVTNITRAAPSSPRIV